MSNGLIILIIAIAVLFIVAYVTAVLLRKRNDTLLANLEERKENLYNLPVNDEVEAIKNMHLIGQSQIAFREWNQKWVDLSLNSFADIENNLFEAEGFNNSFRFLKAKHSIDSIESQIILIEEDIASIREALADLEKQEAKNSGRVLHTLDLFEALQNSVEANSSQYGKAINEIDNQLRHIEAEFSQFVTLNSSGDPVEAAEILDKAEDHILALTHITEKVPAIVVKLNQDLPDQLEDLESGYRKLIESGYHFLETDIESRFQLLHTSLSDNQANIADLELDNAEFANDHIQEEIDGLYDIFTREVKSHKAVEKLTRYLPNYFNHIKENTEHLLDEVERLSQTYILTEQEVTHIRQLQTELTAFNDEVLSSVEDLSTVEKPYSELEVDLEDLQNRLKEIEDEQILLGESLARLEKDDANARQKINIYINKLHTIKRYMEKRNLPGIPAEFLQLFFTASKNAEDLLTELEERLISMEAVNRLLEIVTTDMHELEEKTYQIVQHATLTEQLLQYSNRYRSFDEGVQNAFNKALDIFERDFEYERSFEEISNALELVEPGVTSRFVTSYEKTRENIRF